MEASYLIGFLYIILFLISTLFIRRRSIDIYLKDTEQKDIEQCLDHPSEDNEVNWLDLPDFILSLIANKLNHTADYIRFGAVCHSFRSIYIEMLPCLPPQVPLLMLPTELNPNDKSRSFYSFTEKRVYNYQAPVPQNRFCAGSSHGWLVTVCENYEVRLVNPFSPATDEIHLPPLTSIIEHADDDSIYDPSYLRKAVLSADPVLNPNYVVMAIYGGFSRLAFFKAGNSAWTPILPNLFLVEDVICYKDELFFAVDDDGEVVSFDLSKSPGSMVKIIASGHDHNETWVLGKKYIVISSGKLFQMIRYTPIEYDPMSYCTDKFIVFVHDQIESKWVEVNDLFGKMFFVGDSCTFSLLVPDSPGCKRNCIYFTDDYVEAYYTGTDGIGPHDLGVFNLENGSIEPHYPVGSKMINPPPIWIQPMLR